MLDQTFTVQNLLALRKRVDATKYGQPHASSAARLSKLAQSLAQGRFLPNRFDRRDVGNFAVYSTTSYESAIVLRKINDNLRRLYKLRQADRSTIIKQVACLLGESCPKSVLRLDIESFYESIDRNGILERIESDALLSARSKRLLQIIFQTAFPALGTGLPRGVNVSATLAEFAMRDFDRAARLLPGVYFYARYVDDIVFFTFGDPDEMKERARAILPAGLRLNEIKTRRFTCQCRCSVVCQCRGGCRCWKNCRCRESDGGMHEFDFLGYKFIFSEIPSGKSKQTVTISIADKKVAKTKHRIISSLLAYLADRNFPLLEDRLRFLAGNYRIKASNSDRSIKTGIYYSYRLLSSDHPWNGKLVPKRVAEFDAFFRSAIFAKRSKFGRRLSSALTRLQREQLSQISFKSGFCAKRMVYLSSERLHQLKECWDK